MRRRRRTSGLSAIYQLCHRTTENTRVTEATHRSSVKFVAFPSISEKTQN